MNIIIPMAGLGKRFSESFTLPKPLIKIGQKPMYRYAVDCMPLSLASNLVFILRKSQFSDDLAADIRLNYPRNCSIVILDNETRGQAETILESAAFLNLNASTLVHNCDTYVKANFICWEKIIDMQADGAMVLFSSNEERWSYARLSKDQLKIIEVREKKVISSHASTGTYFFKDTASLLNNIKKIIRENKRENNEYYLSTVYQLMLQQEKHIMPLWADDILCFGTPEDLVNSLNRILIQSHWDKICL